jgi:hypothetical protein
MRGGRGGCTDFELEKRVGIGEAASEGFEEVLRSVGFEWVRVWGGAGVCVWVGGWVCAWGEGEG